MGRPRARLRRGRARNARADAQRLPSRRRPGAARGRALGRDDPPHQGDAAAARRSGQAAYAVGEPAPRHLSATAVAALLWQGIAVVGVSYSLWFWVLKRYAAPQLAAFTFISPLVGVFAGWLAFGDAITPTFADANGIVH